MPGRLKKTNYGLEPIPGATVYLTKQDVEQLVAAEVDPYYRELLSSIELAETYIGREGKCGVCFHTWKEHFDFDRLIRCAERSDKRAKCAHARVTDDFMGGTICPDCGKCW
jgi:hypothetical protein